ncbi:glycosyltransferase family 2 protein [Clostridium perfringens]
MIKDNNIMVTVGCITYNQEKYIAKTIESFLMQKVDFDYEIIIHDDASTDNTAKIIREYEKKYPNLIKGIYQTENQYSKGVITSQIVRKAAKGKYIAFCEGDDYWTDENKLKIQVDFLEKNKDYIAIGHWCDVIDKNDKINTEFNIADKIFNFKKHEYRLSDYKENIIPAHMNTIMHRNIYLNNEYDYDKLYKASNIVGDRTSYLILTLMGKIYIQHRKMSCYRYVTDEGSSYSAKTKGKNRNYEWYMYYNKLEKYIKEVMGIDIKFKRLKYETLVVAIGLYLKDRNDINKNVIKKIINESNKFELIYYFPIALLKKTKSYIYNRI